MKTTTQAAKMKINKDIIYGFIAVLIISGFSLFVGIIFKQNSENEVTEIKKIQRNQEAERKQAALREQKANFKRDSALSVLGKQTVEMNLMNKNFTNLNSNVLNMRSAYDKNFKDLKTIQNEKDHIVNAPVSEQLNFLTKYRYKEYQ